MFVRLLWKRFFFTPNITVVPQLHYCPALTSLEPLFCVSYVLLMFCCALQIDKYPLNWTFVCVCFLLPFSLTAARQSLRAVLAGFVTFSRVNV